MARGTAVSLAGLPVVIAAAASAALLAVPHVELPSIDSAGPRGTPALTYQMPASGSGGRVVLRRSGASLQLVNPTGAVVASAAAGSTGAIVVEGSAADDTLVLDFSGGNPIPAGGLDYDGAGQATVAGDGLVLKGGSFETTRYAFLPDEPSAGHAGTIDLDGSVVRFADLEPIANSGTAANIVFALPEGDGDNLAILEDDGNVLNVVSQLSSGNSSFETTTFSNPSNSLSIDAGDDGETISLLLMDAFYSAATNVLGGAGTDHVSVADNLTLNGGSLDAGGGVDTLDYSTWQPPVAINLGANAPGLAAALDGSQEVPATSSTATGTASIVYDSGAHTFDINMAVSGIAPASITGMHIHRAAIGVNGPIIVDLLAAATPVSDGTGGFTYSANDLPLSSFQEAAFLGGATYVNVHTNSFSNGEIRGQLFATGPFVPAPGRATGTAQALKFENAVGGSDSDSLVGNLAANMLRGGFGGDVLVGTGGNDTVNGDQDDDLLAWNDGDDSDFVNGNAGTDLLQVNGSPGASPGDTLRIRPGPAARARVERSNISAFGLSTGTTETLVVAGLAGNDTVSVDDLTGVASLTAVDVHGLAGNDALMTADASGVTTSARGNLGNDVFALAGAADLTGGVLDGGPGTNTLDYSQATASGLINVDFTVGVATGTGGIARINHAIGSPGQDALRGSTSADRLEGGPGPDLLEGRLGDDVMIGGTERDAVTYFGSATPVTVNLVAGTATGEGSDALSEIEDVVGTNFADTIIGSSLANSLSGLAGDDVINAGNGDDSLSGNEGNDTLRGEGNDDFLEGRGGDDTLIGGTGVDWAFYNFTSAGVTVNLAAGTSTGDGTDTLSQVENVQATGFVDTLIGNAASNELVALGGNDVINASGGDDFVLGNDGNDIIRGQAGLDNLRGGAGDDTLLGGADNDVLDGELGTNRASFQDSLAAVIVNLGAGSATGDGTDALTAIQNVTGSPFADTLTGTNGPNSISGLGGNDVVNAMDGADIVFGGDGNDVLRGMGDNDHLRGDNDNDTLIGGPGDDQLVGGLGVNRAFYAGSATAVTVNLGAGTATGEGSDTLSSIQNVTGSGFADSLTGSNSVANAIAGGDGNDVLRGASGNDNLQGEAGDDVLVGGLGNDVLGGGVGTNRVSFVISLTAVVVNLIGGTATGEGSDTLSLIQNITGSPLADSLTGSNGPNQMLAGNGDDDLFGLGGDDNLQGQNGNDDIDGGAGTDTCLQGPGVGTIVNCSP